MDRTRFPPRKAVRESVPGAGGEPARARAAEGAHQGRRLAAPDARRGGAIQGRWPGLADPHRQGAEEGGGVVGCAQQTSLPSRRVLNQLHAAAFLRLTASSSSTSATLASITGWLKPFCLAMSCTSLSQRSILGAPLNSARAADAGRDRLCAAAAYFSNGTRSPGLAPSLTQRSNTKLYTERDSSILLCTASLVLRMPSLVMQR